MVFEIVIYIVSILGTWKFLNDWFSPFIHIWPKSRIKFAYKYFVLLPLLSLIIYLITLIFFASYDVVNSIFYISFYIFLGFLWIYVSMILISLFLDLSWKDDIIHLNNRSAMPTIAGAYIATTLIYAGANIGDGPGWWCVILADGIGFILFLIIVWIIHKVTNVIETILIDRNIEAGIRMGMFFVAAGIILGRASGGDWISFNQTIKDFWVAWPLLLLAFLAIIIELIYKKKEVKEESILTSVFIGVLYIFLAVSSVFFAPGFIENPIYGLIVGLLL